MSAARERILGAVRRSLRRAGPLPESVRAGLERRLANPIPNLKPALAEDPGQSLRSQGERGAYPDFDGVHPSRASRRSWSATSKTTAWATRSS